jgi:Holliday junction DNA helicase RuvA
VIGRLRGELVRKAPPWLMLDVGGVGYELEAPMSTFYQLPELGQTVALYTHLQVREDAHTLYGFVNNSDRELFRSLLRISGVGAKMALAILSGMDAGAFRRCIQDGDTASLTRLPGIGRKTAERLVVEMRDRIDGLPETAQAGPAPGRAAPEDPVEDAVRALVALGYKPPEASRMVRGVQTRERSSEDIIRLALQASLG